MNIEIRGTQTQNKGAQLMLEAITERFGDSYQLSVPPQMSSYAVRSRLGLHQTLHEYGSPRAVSAMTNLVPNRYTSRYGLVRDRDIDAVLDASGFAYSDSFGAKRSRREALYGRGWKRRGVRKVFLPQAFGPFADHDTKRWAREALDQADLVFARDTVSANYLESLGTSATVRLSPDFTIGLSAIETPRPVEKAYLAVVPNTKMIVSGTINEEDYVSSLRSYVSAARRAGLEPLVVVHERGDKAIADRVATSTGARTFESVEPRVLKSVLGQAAGVVSSRFHAVVGALSQGVPTLAYGWSHKYVELLRDFDVPEWLLTSDADPDERLAALLDDRDGQERLELARAGLSERVEDMWLQTRRILEG